MPSVKRPTMTPEKLAANRRNGLKPTGRCTARGKAWSCMNRLKHGRYAKRVPEKLAEAGNQAGAELYQKIRGEIATTFRADPEKLADMRQLDLFTMKAWLLARENGVLGTKPRSPFFSGRFGPAFRPRLLFQVDDKKRGIRLTYWVQRRRYWNAARVEEVLATGKYPADAPTLAEALEGKLRHGVFKLGVPVGMGRWQRVLLGVDPATAGKEHLISANDRLRLTLLGFALGSLPAAAARGPSPAGEGRGFNPDVPRSSSEDDKGVDNGGGRSPGQPETAASGPSNQTHGSAGSTSRLTERVRAFLLGFVRNLQETERR